MNFLTIICGPTMISMMKGRKWTGLKNIVLMILGPDLVLFFSLFYLLEFEFGRSIAGIPEY